MLHLLCRNRGRLLFTRICDQKQKVKPLRRFISSGGHNSGEWSNERFWAIGAMTITIPAVVWIYNQHTKRPVHGLREADALEHNTVGDIQRELTMAERPIPNSHSDETIDNGSVVPILRAKYLLIGGGTASFAAMEEIRRLEPSADIMIISEERYIPYLRPPLSKELWFNENLTEMDSLKFTDWHGEQKPIFFEAEDFFEVNFITVPSKKTRLILGHKAVDLDIKSKVVTLDDGTNIAYDKVLLATGGRPRMLSVLAEASEDVKKKVSTFRTVEDFVRLRDASRNGKHIVVIGGGFVGSELSVALAQYSKAHVDGGLKISQFFPEDGNMSLVFPKYLSKWTMSKIRRAGVTVLPETHLENVTFDYSEDKVILHLDNEKQLKADHVLVAIGIEPNVELAVKAGLELDSIRGGILTNAELQVRSDVFAAGDAISFHDSSLGIRRRVEHYDHAVLTGKLAGSNMVNPQEPKHYSVQSMFWSDLGPEVGYEAVGLIDSRLTTIGVWAEATHDDSPKGADLDPSDIRAQKVGSITSRSPDTSEHHRINTVISSPANERTYGKGVVFYVKDRRIVGMVMFNLFNRLSLAREIIQKGKTVEELQSLVELFNINELYRERQL